MKDSTDRRDSIQMSIPYHEFRYRKDVTLMSDPEFPEGKPAVLTSTALRGATFARDSEHQHHTLTIETGDDDFAVTVRERYTSGAYEGERTIDFSSLVHLLLNITDDEMAMIMSRQVDHTGRSTAY